MTDFLDGDELAALVRRVFSPGPEDHGLAILADVPREGEPDTAAWRRRRELAAAWAAALDEERNGLGLERISLAWYRATGSNNADLPDRLVWGQPGYVPASWSELAGGDGATFPALYSGHSMVLALTEYSATAPLKVAARRHPFRAATMPGFSPAMIPALRIDYTEVARRVGILAALCSEAESARLVWRADGERWELQLDLRYRQAHASGGLLPRNGEAGNLPSGEAYIVPYEGERPGDPSRSQGRIPVQMAEEIVVYEIQRNRAVKILTTGPQSERESARLAREPAYGNLAELGLGVLGDFGLQPTGSILLDEKLGLHIAFGRSDHFGGQVGPADFSSAAAVIHLDRVYLPRTQPRITAELVLLTGPTGERVIMREGAYQGLF
jgi:hypothetical protein